MEIFRDVEDIKRTIDDGGDLVLQDVHIEKCFLQSRIGAWP